MRGETLFGDGQSTALGRASLFTALLAAILAGLAFAAGPASAELRHANVTAEFGPDGTAASRFSERVNTLSYQQATHRLFVIDAASAGHIYGFENPAPGTFTPLGGAFPVPFSFSTLDSDIAVDNSAGSTAGDLYVAPDNSSFSSFDPSGAALPTAYKGEREICGLAVDNGGDVWASQYGSSEAIEFTPGSAEPVRSVHLEPGASGPCKVAVDQSNNDLYVSAYGEAGVWQYTASSNYTASKKIASGRNNRIAINSTKHVIYVGGPNSEGKVQAFSTVSGELLETIEAPGGPIQGLAVDEATDTLFVAVAGSGKVLEMRDTNVPKAQTGEQVDGAIVGGTVDPDGTGPIAECYFEFGPTASYGSKASCDQSLPIAAPTAVTATLPGLAHETTYHYRLVVANAAPGTTNKANDRTLVIHNVKKLETKPATQVSYTTAQLNAAFEGTNQETHYYFEYGTGTGYGSRVPLASEEAVPASTGPVQIAVPVTGLATGTAYHFRVVAKNGEGTSFGGDEEFHTQAAVEGLHAEAATAVNRTTAQLNASFEGTGEETSYFFEYGTNFSFNSRIPLAPNEETAQGSTGPVQISVPISGLKSGTLYQYRVVAKNSHGTSVSNISELQTSPAVKAVATGEATEITKTSATLNGSYDGATNDTPPGPLEGFHYYFEWGPTESYGHTTAVPPGEDGGPRAETVTVSAQISGLDPLPSSAAPYHYRLVVTNRTGTTFGADKAFRTLPPDPPLVSGAHAEAVQPTAATVSASIDSSGFGASYFVEYGPTVKYERSTDSRALPAAKGAQPIHVDLDRLIPGTIVHYRVVATSEFGTGTSPDQTFITPGAPSVDLSESSAGTDSAHLTVSVIANDRPTEVSFEYGAGDSYGSTAGPVKIEPSVVPETVSADLTGLKPGTTYHFRARATNEFGTTTAPDQVFITQAVPEGARASEAKAVSCRRGLVRHGAKCVKKARKHLKHRHGRRKHRLHHKRSRG